MSTPDLKVILIILIIILNLHNPSLRGFGYNTRRSRPRALDIDLTARSCYKNIIIKKKKKINITE